MTYSSPRASIPNFPQQLIAFWRNDQPDGLAVRLQSSDTMFWSTSWQEAVAIARRFTQQETLSRIREITAARPSELSTRVEFCALVQVAANNKWMAVDEYNGILVLNSPLESKDSETSNEEDPHDIGDEEYDDDDDDDDEGDDTETTGQDLLEWLKAMTPETLSERVEIRRAHEDRTLRTGVVFVGFTGLDCSMDLEA